MYLPKILIDGNLDDTMTNYWQYFVFNFWKEILNVKLDAIEKIFIVFEVNTDIKLRDNQKKAFREICESLDKTHSDCLSMDNGWW